MRIFGNAVPVAKKSSLIPRIIGFAMFQPAIEREWDINFVR
jgi:hypothetical protein